MPKPQEGFDDKHRAENTLDPFLPMLLFAHIAFFVLICWKMPEYCNNPIVEKRKFRC